MNIFSELTRDGGYVFARFHHQADCKVGEVKSGSKIKIQYDSWGTKCGYIGRIAAIKCILLTNVRRIHPTESINFKAVHPRQGAVVYWNAIGDKVKYPVTGEDHTKTVSSLSPTELEVMCSEYLRSYVCREDINKIQSLQLPVGRTLVDVDIVGNDKYGKTVIAQVTYGTEKGKVKKLAKYLDEVNSTAQAIMIWNGGEIKEKKI